MISTEERVRYRAVLKHIDALIQPLKNFLSKGIMIPAAIGVILTEMTNSVEPANQLRALEELYSTINRQYDEELKFAAQFKFSPFCEYMRRDEVPALHHEFLISHMEAVHAHDIMRLSISLPPGSAKMVRDNTSVTTAYGTKAISEIKVGDVVLTHTGNYRPVTAIHLHPQTPEWVIQLENGTELSCSHDHSWLTPRGWIQTQNLVPGENMATPLDYDIPKPTDISDAEIDLLAWWHCKGMFDAYRPQITLSAGSDPVSLENALRVLGIEYPQRNKKGRLPVTAQMRAAIERYTPMHKRAERVLPQILYAAASSKVKRFIALQVSLSVASYVRSDSNHATSRMEMSFPMFSQAQEFTRLAARVGVHTKAMERVGGYGRILFTPEAWDQLIKEWKPLPRRIRLENSSGMDIHDFRLTGLLLGDGSVSHYGIGFTQGDLPTLQVYNESWVAKGLPTYRIYRGNGCVEVHSGTRIANDYAKYLGISGLNSYTKTVPEWVYSGGEKEIADFLGGAFMTDGCITEVKPSKGRTVRRVSCFIASVSRALLEGYAKLFDMLGITTNIIEKHATYKDRPYTSYNIYLNSYENIAKFFRLAYIVGDKRTRYEKYALDGVFDSDTYQEVKIISVTNTGTKEDMRCLTVEEDHSFVANGVITHNSTYASIRFAAWHLGRKPNDRWLQGAHTQGFAKDRLGKPVRGLMQDPRYNAVFPEMKISSSSSAADYFEFTGGTGYYKAVGVGVGIAGYRADIGCIDDPLASREDAESATTRRKLHEWYEDDFGTRPMPGSPIFVVSTRWHDDDLVGYELSKMKEGKGEDWIVINIPAIAIQNDPLGRPEGEGLWPEVFGTDFYLGKKRGITGRSWNSLYQGNPVDEEGGVLKREDVKRYKNLPKDEARSGVTTKKVIKRITLSIDCAEKATQRSDYTAATVWLETTDKKHYLVHAARVRKEFVEMVEWIEHLAKTWNVDQILVEDKGSGTQYIQVRKISPGAAPVIAIATMQKSKEFRFDGVTPMFAAGEVFLPEIGTDWIADVEAELFAFPNAKNDDYVDTVSQYLARARESSGSRRGTRKMRTSTMA